ncbi:hypothetical protein ABT294_47030 [Nonomuraea sp. NPDC000554]|uniref:WD40 repeat domain-containing protein n=1 Tax=Nonomuraea sp. NPDC000554 TaxID=3154259 RepID=UPI00332246FA
MTEWATGNEIDEAHEGGVTALDVSMLDMRPLAVTGGHDRIVRVWDLATGTPLGEPMAWLPDEDGDGLDVGSVAYLRLDGRDVAVAGVDRSLWLWDLGTVRPLRRECSRGREHGRREWR